MLLDLGFRLNVPVEVEFLPEFSLLNNNDICFTLKSKRLESNKVRLTNFTRFPFKAPDRNPENIKIQGHLPHQMDISWEVRNRARLFMKPYIRRQYSFKAFSESRVLL